MKKVSSLLELDFVNNINRTLFCPIQQAMTPASPTRRHTKISMIGVGNVGMTISMDELTLVDAKPDKLRGEMLGSTPWPFSCTLGSRHLQTMR
ncbi:hypothetical protein C4D60_Mb09t05530 [Musa balbisiana]|uniref:Lactate/malate dehydrogenase N-terminal domain-containing protein n=1 Tax=Musa balbisiana TaxID=52838 RepID=A0A4S8IGM8_MUSBA|nr:hypothetical protein C4D60_Mb09t05530 [Musa balbisiana]